MADISRERLLAELKRREAAEAAASSPPPAPASTPPAAGPSQGEAAARGFAQGATLGFGDEVVGLAGAAGAALGGSGVDPEFLRLYGPDGYTEARDEDRAANSAAGAAHPLTFMGSYLGGGLLPVLAAGAAAPGEFAGAAGAAELGAGLGAVAGAGDSLRLQDMPADAVKGGVLGGVLGPALHGAGQAIRLVPRVTSSLASAVSGEAAEAGGAGPFMVRLGTEPFATKTRILDRAMPRVQEADAAGAVVEASTYPRPPLPRDARDLPLPAEAPAPSAYDVPADALGHVPDPSAVRLPPPAPLHPAEQLAQMAPETPVGIRVVEASPIPEISGSAPGLEVPSPPASVPSPPASAGPLEDLARRMPRAPTKGQLQAAEASRTLQDAKRAARARVGRPDPAAKYRARAEEEGFVAAAERMPDDLDALAEAIARERDPMVAAERFAVARVAPSRAPSLRAAEDASAEAITQLQRMGYPVDQIRASATTLMQQQGLPPESVARVLSLLD